MTKQIAAFRKVVYQHYDALGRKTLPWRLTSEPWSILLSEFMLQQTQIERVVSYWTRWCMLWPNAAALAASTLETALREWSGLGYNRRCLHLWGCAHRICAEYGGLVPQTPEELRTLSGIGPYCAGAIACFAYNYPSVFIETNIRAALLSYFFDGRDAVKDSELTGILEEALDRDEPRLWYWALMDYGAMIKKSAVNPNRRSAHYARQSRFQGSFRQSRGEFLRALLSDGPATADELQRRTDMERELLHRVAESLEQNRMVCRRNGIYMITEH